MLDRLADLLPWPGRVRRFDVDATPADVLLQSSIMLRGLGVSIRRLDLDAGTLEAELLAGARLRVRAESEADGSRVAIDVAGRDWLGIARVLARELEHGAAA
jgi:hypothetical protein